MKSTEVYSLLRSELAPWFKSEGFKRTKELLGWSRPSGGAYTVVWCQVSRDGWDPFAGSRFVVEFQRSADSHLGSFHATRERLGKLLSQEEREEVRRIQNSVIAELRPAPATHPWLQISPEVTAWYLKEFKPVSEPYSERDDIWFRYASPEHVSNWAKFILEKLPKCVDFVESWPIQPGTPTPPALPGTAP